MGADRRIAIEPSRRILRMANAGVETGANMFGVCTGPSSPKAPGAPRAMEASPLSPTSAATLIAHTTVLNPWHGGRSTNRHRAFSTDLTDGERRGGDRCEHVRSLHRPVVAQGAWSAEGYGGQPAQPDECSNPNRTHHGPEPMAWGPIDESPSSLLDGSYGWRTPGWRPVRTCSESAPARRRPRRLERRGLWRPARS